MTQHFPLLLKKNNLRKIRFHDLRHRCASLLLYADGVSLKQIQDAETKQIVAGGKLKKLPNRS